MADFFSSRFLRWLTVPARSRVLNYASRPFYTIADRILGSQFLEDIAEFFMLFQSMYSGFVKRANAVTRVLGDRRTTFVVVSTLESAPVREAQYFISELRNRELHLGAVVLNKVLPGYLLDRGATRTAHRLCAEADVIAGKLVDERDPAVLERVLREVGNSFLNFQVVANREAETRAELSSIPDVVANVPYFDSDIYDLAGLIRVGDKIWR
jgi:anion-transporting  ArsA/GET3 family ATPase